MEDCFLLPNSLLISDYTIYVFPFVYLRLFIINVACLWECMYMFVNGYPQSLGAGVIGVYELLDVGDG